MREEQARLAELRPVVGIAAERATNLPIWRAALALMHAKLGQVDEAHAVLAALAARDFADLPLDGNLLGTWARLAEVVAILDERRWAETLLARLAPHAGSVVVLATTAGCLGSAARHAGLLARTAGRLDEAVAYFETALGVNTRLGALPQLAHAQHDLARTLRARGAAGDVERAAALDAEAGRTAGRLGLAALAAELATADAPAPPPARAPAAGPHRARLHREGDVWTIACDGELTRVRATKGVGYLAELLRHPGREFNALDLGGAEDLRAGDAGEMLDAEARRAYKARLGDLREELTEAEERNDLGRIERLRDEMEAIADKLARASGLGGRSRKAGSDAERARLNVTRALRGVIRKVASDCPILGGHLDRSVQTGIFCAYEPDPAFPVDWQV